MDWHSFVHTWQNSTLSEKPAPHPTAAGEAVYAFETPLTKLGSGTVFGLTP